MNNIEILKNAIYEMQEQIEVYEEQGNVEEKEGLEEVQQAIENLIKENKELKEKDKKWEELYDEDQEYITQLNNKIFQLEIDNKKLDKENQGLFEAYNFNDTNLFAKTLKEYRKEILNSVPKSKVKEKIEELDRRIDYLDKELNKAYIEREKLGTETEIDMNEQYIYNMEQERSIRHTEKYAYLKLLEGE